MNVLACLGLLSCSKSLGLQLQSFHLLEIKNSKEKYQTTLFNVPKIL
jgi:hypothetical protein